MQESRQFEPVNVFGENLQPCSNNPLTGFFRDGCCNSSSEDHGSHTVCIAVTEDFLAFSKRAGNDLSTPMPEFDFPGLKAGDRWCLCAARWLQAYEQGAAPRIYMARTHEKALDIIPPAILRRFAMDLS